MLLVWIVILTNVDFNFIWDGNSLGILAGLIGGFQEYCCQTASN
jgi:hypothetical protein